MNKTRITAALLAAFLLLTGCRVTSADVTADSAGIRIENGMAQQIVPYTNAQDLAYTNENSEILRFCVYVETDRDTDLDGKADLIKTLVQLPRPAAEGRFKAPVIYEARPYIAGMYGYSPELKAFGESDFDEEVLYAEPVKRTPAGEIDTLDLAAAAEPSDWFYKFDSDPFDQQYMGNFTTYDDLLVCGFAIVQCAGPGTWGSEGIECCTSGLEAEAFACVIDWLCGRRNAYSNLTDNIRVDADWSSGRVGMTGRSYAGAMAVEVASLGPDGLETIVPVAAPASWYDYTNSQGIPLGLYDNYDFAADLSAMCASRMFTDPPQALREHYDRYLSWLRDAQILAGGDYNEFWQARDFLQSDSFDVSALIVQGLHDVVVHPKQFDLLRSALLRCGCDVKCLLHQNGHVTPANEQTMTDILIGEHTYTELLNRWFTHYLLDADNGIDDMSAFTVQSNVDGSFYASESWNSGPVLELASGDPAGREYTVSAAGARLANQSLLADTLDGSSGSDHLLLAAMRADEDLTIAGVPRVRLRVRTKDISHPFPMLAAVLVDTAEAPFPCYDVEWSEVLEQEILQENAVKRGEGVVPYSLASWKQRSRDRQIISYGSMDLRNPSAGYEPASAAAPADPPGADEYYEYTLYLQPGFYTVKAGHELQLYVIPYCGFSNDSAFYDSNTEEKLRQLGFDPACMLPVTRDYSFTVDTQESRALIPLAR